jgi:aminodeoxyfutalosine deaminase
LNRGNPRPEDRAGVKSSNAALVDVHLHFEGSIPLHVLKRLAVRSGRSVSKLPARGAPLQRGRGFDRFLEAFLWSSTLLRTREDVFESASALFTRLATEGVQHADVSISPQVHQRRGLSFSSLMHGLAAARRDASRKYGLSIAYIADGGRLWGGVWFDEMIHQAALYKADGLAAVGLGGDEVERGGKEFRRGFERARKLGLKTVAHAGERGLSREVRTAMLDLEVSRIGHGIAAVKDAGLMRELAARSITLEICLTSNYQTGAITELRRHPLPLILEAGIPVALGSDDRTVFGTSLRREYWIAASILGLAETTLAQIALNSVAVSLATARVKTVLAGRIRSRFFRGPRGSTSRGTLEANHGSA